ncbi:SpoIVB peptidase S55 [Natroniella sulfidigena]|uniref:SpoIVB peptidase S55 domain-containing protein n=1 Tax=Natroniella sulfidigena TaxID=723921 RepID=UPI002009FC5E|nr:SpoIVB peptidase S55 domain-containing protein [Natroniella sulfidigena]MCK8816378.1 SpoIVB peptidase S55 [Natroniella sulfidigena]
MRLISKTTILVLLCLLVANVALATEQEIMPLTDIESGMQGVGRTVLRGTEIEEFDVEIISMLDSSDLSQDLILVKTSGDVIERSGGIAAGMSGSPIYVDDKLIGAIGYGWQMADHKIGLVTPIESMLDLLELETGDLDITEDKEIALSTPLEIDDQQYEKIAFTSDEQKAAKDNILVATPVNTPLLVSGLSGRAKDRLAEGLDDYDLMPVSGGGLMEQKENDIPFEPGSAMAVQLMRGDINVSAIGTLTYRDQDQILGLGHSFLSQGSANYLLSSAYIHQMITSIEMPFKIGSPAELKGVITQDRTAGVAGKVGSYPNIVPVKVNLNDQDLAKSDTYNLQIVQDEDLIEELAATALLQAIDSTIDRQGAGTAKVSWEAVGSQLPDGTFESTNLYYSGNDIAVAALSDFIQGLSLVMNNPFQQINLANIEVDIEIKEESKVALLEEVSLEQEQARPGEKVDLKVKLRPYRQEVIEKEIELKIPEDTPEGNLAINLLSGQEANFNLFYTEQPEEAKQSKANNIKSLEELIEIYQLQNKNNSLVIELQPLPDYSSAQDDEFDSIEKEEVDLEEVESGEQESVQQVEVDHDLVEEVIETDYVLTGSLIKEIEIITEED